MADKPNREIPKALLMIMTNLSRRDMRVGQMFSNLFDLIRSQGKNPFYVENDELLKLFFEYINRSGMNPFDE